MPNDISEAIKKKTHFFFSGHATAGGARSSQKVNILSHNSTPLRTFLQFSFHLGT
jgi:hypothetical protein